jgi:hypothetical protein
LYIKRACELNKSHIISTDEDPGLRIESFAVINLRGVSTNKTVQNCSPGNMGWNIVKRNAGSLIDDVRRDIAINFMLTWHKLSFLIGQFEFEV